MYAVIQTGGKQYKVEQGSTINIEKLEQGIGTKYEFDKVLMVKTDNAVKIGQPYIESGKVSAEIVAQDRAKKINVLKFKRRKTYMKRMGHRQYFTKVKITSISV